MRTMLLSLKASVYERVAYGEKIYEHRKVFPDEPIKAYLYVSTPIKAIVGIMHLSNKTEIVKWKSKYSYDQEAVKRIDEYLKDYKFAMEITDFQNTNKIPLDTLRKDLDKFVVPQMYYFIDNSPLLKYLEDNLVPEGSLVKHSFENVPSDKICKS